MFLETVKLALTALLLVVIPGVIGAAAAAMAAPFMPPGRAAQGALLAIRFIPVWSVLLWQFNPADIGLRLPAQA